MFRGFTTILDALRNQANRTVTENGAATLLTTRSDCLDSFDYEDQPSCAMYKYRRAFLRNDGERYLEYMEDVSKGKAVLHTASLTPSDLVDKALSFHGTQEERRILDITSFLFQAAACLR